MVSCRSDYPWIRVFGQGKGRGYPSITAPPTFGPDKVWYGYFESSLPPRSGQVWISSIRPLWVYLTPLLTTMLCWQYGCLHHFWCRLTVVILPYSATRMGRPYCGDAMFRKWLCFPCLAGFSIYPPPQRLLFVSGFCWTQLHSVFITMSSPSPSGPQAPCVDTALPPPSRTSIEEGRSNHSLPLQAASFSEVLIGGVNGPG